MSGRSLNKTRLRVAANWLVVGGLAAITVVNAWLRFFPSGPVAPESIEHLDGRHLRTTVRTANVATGRRLSDIAPGRCVYLVVTEANCGAGAAAAREWQRLAARRQLDSASLDGWYIAWISAGDSAQMAGFYPDQFAFNRYFTPDSALMKELRLPQVPDHFVLDRNGVVTLADGGAPLPDKSDFKSDCTINGVTSLALRSP